MTTADRQSGFTLVELLVSMALVALLSVFCIESLGRMQEIRRIESQLEVEGQLQAARRQLQRMISGARIGTLDTTTGLAETPMVGLPESFRFINALDDRLVRGGIYTLAFMFEADRKSVTFSYRDRSKSPDRPDDKLVLLEDVASFSVSYFGSLSGADAPAWHSEWNNTWLPKAVRINASFDDPAKQWTPLLIRIETAG
jgi:general secretion pathway protein J